MCGIAGYFSSSGKFHKGHLELANQVMHHRGPDAQGVFHDEWVGLAHRRLSILDLSSGANQPMYSADERYVAVYNGEVYNFAEIEQEIKQHRKDFVKRTTSDTEIIIEAFSLWKDQAAERFNGMFAIAIYDRVEKELTLIRDRMGIKPVYYYHDGDNFFFASELKVIKALRPAIALTVDELAVSDYFHLGYIPQPRSIYREVKKMPSGTVLKVKKGNVESKAYWKLNDKFQPETLKNFSQAKARLKELVISSVRYRMISDVPFGTFLSGGIDSSLVTAAAQSISEKPVSTFSIGFNENKYNESIHAEKVARHLGTNHHPFTVTHHDAMELFDKLDSIYDEPYADTSAIPTMMVSALARKHVTMTLSGDGGDELFMGYGAYRWAERLNNPMVNLFGAGIRTVLGLGDNRMKRAAHLFGGPNGTRLHSHIFSQEQYFYAQKEFQNLFAKKLPVEDVAKDLLNGIARQLSAKEQQALFDMNFYLRDCLLVKVDRATMQHSLETRVPLLDYRIVEFALNLDESLKVKGDVMKYLLKEVLYDFVPAEYFNRPKQGFSIPLQMWLKKELRYLIEDYASEAIIRKHGWINPDYVKELLHRYLTKNEDYLYNRVLLVVLFHKFLEADEL
jgi:asparagine synthase (glutamine-hydrolysing)